MPLVVVGSLEVSCLGSATFRRNWWIWVDWSVLSYARVGRLRFWSGLVCPRHACFAFDCGYLEIEFHDGTLVFGVVVSALGTAQLVLGIFVFVSLLCSSGPSCVFYSL